MKKIIHLLAAIILLAGAGCAGGTGASGGSPGGNPAVGEPNPVPVNPFGTPGDGTTEVETTEGEETPPAATPRQPRTPPPDDTPRPQCFSNNLPDGEVGQAYSYTLEAEGGSGEFGYSLKSGALPEGLALSEDGEISGTPTTAAESRARVTVTDAESGKTKNCSVDITIRGDLGLTKEILFGKEDEWDAVYKITASEGFDDLTWTWDGDTNNVCTSGTAPNTNNEDFRTDCTPGTLSVSENVVYVWLQEDQQDDSTITVTLKASSPHATNEATRSFVFTYTPAPVCGNGVKEGTEACDREAVTAGSSCNADCTAETRNPAAATSVTVTFWTGNAGDGSDTDCTVKIKFCQDKLMDSNCTIEVVLNDTADGDDRENGDENIYDAEDGLTPAALGGYMSDAYRYFRISLVGGCGDDTNSWLLQGVKAEIRYPAPVPSYTYFNPCAEKWMNKNDHLDFGPNDTAVCSIIKTGTDQYAGTNDSVYLVMDNFDYGAAQEGFVDGNLVESGPHFVNDTDGEADKVAVQMHWGYPDDIDDFENNDNNSYGDYLFDVDLPDLIADGDAPRFRIRKNGDGDYGGWKLEYAKVYVFQPGKFLNDPGKIDTAIYYAREDFNRWLSDGSGLATTSVTLEPASAGKITWGIGDNFVD